MGSSVAKAATLATNAECDALLIALADMPLVPSEHYHALVDAMHRGHEIVVSARGAVRMPPALFSHGHFAALSELDGDKGARELLAQGQVVECPPEWLIDIDTPEALRQVE